MGGALGTILGLWWLWLGIFALWLRQYHKLPADLILTAVAWWVIQYKVFPDNYLFTLGLVLFTPLMAGIYFLLERRRDVYLLESRLQDEELIYPDGTSFLVPDTSAKLWHIPRQVYDIMDHVGDLRAAWWLWGDTLIFADYVDWEKKLIFHPEQPEIKNISFSTARRVWLAFKIKYPEIVDRMTRLTWLRDIEIMEHVDKTFEESILAALALNKIDKTPFDPLGLDEIRNRRRGTKKIDEKPGEEKAKESRLEKWVKGKWNERKSKGKSESAPPGPSEAAEGERGGGGGG